VSAVRDAARVVLSTLALRDFRNLARLDLEIPDAGAVVIGENGQGKTNLLEAIYYLHLLRSVRGARDVDIVRFGAAGFHIAARTGGGKHHELSAGFERQGRRKRVKVDGAEPARLSDALGALPCVLFSPADVDLVAGAPSSRRRYLDILLALSSRPYLAALQRYRAALAQRNAALRDALRSAGGRAEQRVAVWEAPLAEHGAVLWRERVRWTERAAGRFAELCAAIG
jgi:DNA replication and repair protein RecF